MGTKELLDGIKQEFEAFKARFKFNEEVKLGQVTLADGTVLSYEGELAPGTMLKMADGSPAPDGEHQMEDGSVIMVAGGQVIEVKSVAPAEEEMNAEFAEKAKFEEAVGQFNQRFEALESNFATLSEQIALLVGMTEKSVAAFAAFSEQAPDPINKPVTLSRAEAKAIAREEALKNLQKHLANN